MKLKVLIIGLIAIVIAIVGAVLNIKLNAKSVYLSDTVLANIEALAQGESWPGSGKCYTVTYVERWGDFDCEYYTIEQWCIVGIYDYCVDGWEIYNCWGKLEGSNRDVYCN